MHPHRLTCAPSPSPSNDTYHPHPHQYIDLYDASDNKYFRLHRCKGHSSTVSHLDWSVDSRLLQVGPSGDTLPLGLSHHPADPSRSTSRSPSLQTQCNAYELLYWNTDRGAIAEGWTAGEASPFETKAHKRMYGRQITDEQRDTEWATWTCIMGFDVMGIWPPDYMNTDIDMVARSPTLKADPHKKYLAASDHFGGILIANYPVRGAPSPSPSPSPSSPIIR